MRPSLNIDAPKRPVVRPVEQDPGLSTSQKTMGRNLLSREEMQKFLESMNHGTPPTGDQGNHIDTRA